ncbi:OmpA family protein [Roseococcus sp. SDR]|uniref:OmpA family protein n=1 Tax=Roseococcus sp. SDR TaxID=2835532 RepID=UPI001BCE2C89|nr:OmpA family protein [Roseococcus sp. SDR]MBS7789065.1 OmpA family protein [Roseococcus sp. SDR]MBV1844379.1 OmpA family protein [Roseococcus sp. SDR]
MSLKKALMAATVLSLPVAAQAQPISGLYLGAGVGANYRENNTVNPRLSPSGILTGQVGVDTDWGWAGVISVGWGFGNGLRAELEANVRQGSVGSASIASAAGTRAATNTGGQIYQYGLMGNVLYDIQTGWRPGGVSITPYVGGGIGVVQNNWRNVRASAPGVNITMDDTANNFAYQAIGGVAFGITPALALTLEYRFFGSTQPDIGIRGQIVGGPNNGVRLQGNYDGDNLNQSVLAGIRYAFNVPTPAPVAAPAPAPAPARTFLVFFDWDRADLTDRARQIIAEAATNARTVRSTRIEVSGHADRTGSAAYNQRLSVRRAEAVAAELVRRGIPRNEMTIQGFGFDRPLVPTAMGVREPQNRRVEIVLR